MLFVLLLIIVQVLVSAGIGHWLISRGFGQNQHPLEFNIILGLGFIGIIGHCYSLYAPIGWGFKLTIIIGGLMALSDNTFLEQISRYKQRLIHQPLYKNILLLLLVLVACFLAAGPIIRDDSESYHLQNILWIKSYGTVPGLANLHSRYGFNSIWFHTVATLVPEGQLNYYTTPNALLSIVIASFLSVPIDSKNNLSNTAPTLLTLFLHIAIWYYWRGNAQSTNYDYYYMTAVVIFFIHFTNQRKKKYEWEPWAIWIPPILFCIRPLYAPALIFSIIGIISYWKVRRYAKSILFTCGILTIILLFLYRNYVLTGYPLFPSTLIKFSDTIWKMPQDQVDQLYEYIRNYTFERKNDTIKALKIWFNEMYLYDIIFMVLGMCGIFWDLILTILNKNTTKIIWTFYFVLQIAIWIFISPEPRFISGIFAVGHFLLFMKISVILKIQKSNIIMPTLILTMIFSLCIISINKIKNETSKYMNFLVPHEIPNPETHTFTWEGKKIQIPEKLDGNWNPRCYLIAPPCVYDSLPGIKMLGDKIENGFYVDKRYKRNIP